jgi:hypothetical protein
MAADPVMLELVRSVKMDVSAVHTDLKTLADDVRENAASIAKLQNSNGVDMNKMIKKLLPWLAAMGIGAGGGGALLGHQAAEVPNATEVRHGGSTAGTTGTAAGVQGHAPHHPVHHEPATAPKPSVGRAVGGGKR